VENGFAERLIGTIRRECVDHLVVFGEAHLRRVLIKFYAYYNECRIHHSLNKMHHSIERSSASVPSQHDLFLAAFITNIAGLDFQHTG
jgi:transposase InsO family protein